MAEWLVAGGVVAAAYHAGLSMAVRRTVHRGFITDEVQVVLFPSYGRPASTTCYVPFCCCCCLVWRFNAKLLLGGGRGGGGLRPTPRPTLASRAGGSARKRQNVSFPNLWISDFLELLISRCVLFFRNFIFFVFMFSIWLL